MITAFTFCARAIFSLLEKTHPPWFTKFVFGKFFSLFYIISTQRSYIYIKPDVNRCFAKLREISNLFGFFLYTLYIQRTFRKTRGNKLSKSERMKSDFETKFRWPEGKQQSRTIWVIATSKTLKIEPFKIPDNHLKGK
jgi:hypothetical protein